MNNHSSTYDIDDILEEVAAQRSGGHVSSASADAPTVPEADTAVSVEAAKPDTEAVTVTERPRIGLGQVEPSAHRHIAKFDPAAYLPDEEDERKGRRRKERKSDSAFVGRKRTRKKGELFVLSPADTQESEEVVEPATQAEATSEQTAVAVMERATVTVEPEQTASAPIEPEKIEPEEIAGATRVIVVPEESKPHRPVMAFAAPIPQEDDRQLTFEGYHLQEEAVTEDDGEPVEARVQRIRQDRVEEFRLNRSDDPDAEEDAEAPAADDPLPSPPPMPAPEKQDEVLEDYTDYEDTPLVRTELRYRLRTAASALLMTGVLETICILVTLASAGTFREGSLFFFMVTLHAILLAVMLIVNFQTVRRGILSLVRLQADSESAAALSGVAVLIHTLMQYVSSGSSGVPTLTPIAGAALFLAALGRYTRSKRIYENFRFVSYPGDKFAAQQITDPKTAVEIGRPAVALGTPHVTYFQRLPFLPRFLECSYATDAADACMKVFVPCALGGSLLLGLLYGFIRGWWLAAAIGIGALSVTLPAALLAVNLPLFRASKKALRCGGMLSGWDSVCEFENTHALVVNAADLFPDESILLHGIKTFDGTRIDQAILDIAAITINAGGTIASVFRRVIENRLEILPPVDSLVYEHDMGLSGWVNGRRVLVGNRRLLENHGVDTPSLAYEERYRKNDRQLIYLASGGALAAMIVVSYTGDDNIASLLDTLCRAGVTLLVRTNDPNVTASLISRTFELDEYYIEMLSATASRTCSAMLEAGQPDPRAHIGSNGRIEGMAAALSGCRQAKRSASLGILAQVVCGVLCFGLCAVSALSTGALPTEAFALTGTGMVLASAALSRLISRIGGI